MSLDAKSNHFCETPQGVIPDFHHPEKRDAKLPWMKFYPVDWRGESSLRVCTLAARGLWMEMLTVMHSADPAGSLTMNGRQMTTRQLAALVGATAAEVEGLLQELEESGVFSRDEDGTIYSRRIRRDVAQALVDKANGKRGGNPILKGGDKAQRLEARGKSPEARKKDSGVGNQESIPEGVGPHNGADAPSLPLEIPDPKPKPVGRGERMPQDFKPDETGRKLAVDTLGNTRAHTELAKFRDFWLSKAGQNGRKLDWQATWRNWVRRAAEISSRAPGPPKPSQQTTRL